MRYKSYKCIITFLILLTTCSTYYLHWYNPPYTKKGTVESLQNNRVLEIGPTGLKPVVTIPIAGPAESAVLQIGVHGSHESTAEKSVRFPMKELSVDVRKQAEMFLRGAKPAATTSKKQITQSIDADRVKSSDKKGPKCSFPEWIVFAGDSNMRHTYHYWISTIKGYHNQIKSHTFAIDSKRKSNLRWADQETILEFENNCILRASFRFLHGSTSEFIHVFTHWHEFRKYEPFEDQDPNKFNPQNGLVVNKNTVRPSDYALMTTQKRIAIDCQVSNPLLCSKLKQFKNKKPSWVVLTEGWGGVPYCSWFHEATEIMTRYPSIKFIWAPIYVTNNNEQRYDCFKRISNNFQPNIDNLKMLDFWDISSKKLPKHTAVGGTHMRTAVKRFSDVWKSSDKSSKQENHHDGSGIHGSWGLTNRQL